MNSTTKKLYSVQYIKMTKAISDFEDNIMQATDDLHKLNSKECKELIEDLEGTIQSLKFLANSLNITQKAEQ